MDRAYYLKYYDFEKNHWWFRARAEILKDYIGKHCQGFQKLKIINVGAATGGSIEWLTQLGEVTSLEFDKESVSFIREHLKAGVTEGSILSLPFEENTFDLVCAFDVIEHIEDDIRGVQELARVCKSKGSVLITVPAHMHLWSQHDVVNHHYRRYEVRSLLGLLKALPKGNVKFITYFNHYFYIPIMIIRRMNNLFSLLLRSKKLKSDFETFRPGVTNEFFFSVMAREKKRVSSQIGFRQGVSILAHWAKD